MKVRQLKFDEVGSFSDGLSAAIAGVTSEAIKPVAQNYGANVDRVRSLWSFPSILNSLVLTYKQTLRDHSPTHQIIESNIQHRARQEAALLAQLSAEQLAEHRRAVQENENRRKFPGGVDTGLSGFENVVQTVRSRLPEGTLDRLYTGIETTLGTMIISGWLAFETLAGDLWETAINAHPAGLAEQKGDPNGNKAPKTPKKEHLRILEATQKNRTERIQISLRDVIECSYDTKDNMGTILKRNHNFTRLSEIHEAYRVAFWCDDKKIDDVFEAKSIKELNLVRNILIHKNGIIDREFTDRSKSLPRFQHYKRNDKLLLDGQFTHSLLEPSVRSAMNLINAVDEWLRAHPG